MNHSEIRPLIDTLERLEGVMAAITDVGSIEFDAGERETVKLAVADHSEAPISFVHDLPPQLVLVGLRAMQAVLESVISAQRDDLSRAVSQRQEMREVVR